MIEFARTVNAESEERAVLILTIPEYSDVYFIFKLQIAIKS